MCMDFLTQPKVDVPKSNIAISWRLCFSDMWLGVDLRMLTKKACVQKRFDHVLKIH